MQFVKTSKFYKNSYLTSGNLGKLLFWSILSFGNISDYSRTTWLLEGTILVANIRTMFPWWSCGFCSLSILIRPNFDTKHLVSTFYTYSPLLWEARGPGGLNTIHHLSLALSSVKEKFFCRLSQSSLHFPLVEAKFFFIQTLFPAIFCYTRDSGSTQCTKKCTSLLCNRY